MSQGQSMGDNERRAAARRNAILLAVVVAVIYGGYIVWNLLRSAP